MFFSVNIPEAIHACCEIEYGKLDLKKFQKESKIRLQRHIKRMMKSI